MRKRLEIVRFLHDFLRIIAIMRILFFAVVVLLIR
jgi:hypothetical protein